MGGGSKRLRRLPTLGAVQPDLILHREVIADNNIQPSVRVHVEQRNGEGLRLVGQPLRDEAATAIFVVEDACAAAEHELVTQFLFQLRVIRAGHQVQIAVPIQVAPGHGVGRVEHAGQGLLHELLAET